MVEMEQAYGAQAPALPEYQFLEQLLVQRGAFEEGRQQHSEHAHLVAEGNDLEEIVEERQGELGITEQLPQLRMIMFVLAALAVVCIVMAFVFASH